MATGVNWVGGLLCTLLCKVVLLYFLVLPAFPCDVVNRPFTSSNSSHDNDNNNYY